MRLRLRDLSLPLVGVVFACGSSPSGVESAPSSILSGTPSDDMQVVLLAFDNGFLLKCSGTLIAPDVVLTAAHCVGPSTAWAYVGYSKAGLAIESNTGAKRYRIVDSALMKIDEAQCPMAGVDVGLLRLETSSDVPPAALADHEPEIGDECVVAGYGMHSPGAGLDLVEQEGTDWTMNQRRQARIRVFDKSGAGTSDWFSARASTAPTRAAPSSAAARSRAWSLARSTATSPCSIS